MWMKLCLGRLRHARNKLLGEDEPEAAERALFSDVKPSPDDDVETEAESAAGITIIICFEYTWHSVM